MQVFFLIASDGGQGTGFAAARGVTGPSGLDLVRIRTEEARCAAQALGVQPPILLDFPTASWAITSATGRSRTD